MPSAQSQAAATGFPVSVSGPSETERLAARLAGVAVSGDVLALHGPLGAGKTAFARGFIRALAAPDEEVPSPTFTLAQLYEGATAPIHHFDLYRIEDAGEIHELGLEEAISEGITLIEWPEKAETLRSDRWLDVRFELDPDDPEARTIVLDPGGAWHDRIAALISAFRDPAHV